MNYSKYDLVFIAIVTDPKLLYSLNLIYLFITVTLLSAGNLLVLKVIILVCVGVSVPQQNGITSSHVDLVKGKGKSVLKHIMEAHPNLFKHRTQVAIDVEI